MIRPLAAVGVALALSGCPHVDRDCMQVESAKANDVRITFCGKNPKYNGVTVEREAGDDILWSIGPVGAGNHGAPLGELRYGVVPDGWAQGGTVTPLQPGDRIVFVANGLGHKGSITVAVE